MEDQKRELEAAITVQCTKDRLTDLCTCLSCLMQNCTGVSYVRRCASFDPSRQVKSHSVSTTAMALSRIIAIMRGALVRNAMVFGGSQFGFARQVFWRMTCKNMWNVVPFTAEGHVLVMRTDPFSRLGFLERAYLHFCWILVVVSHFVFSSGPACSVA